MMNRRIIHIMIFCLLVCLATSTGWAQSSKIKALSSGSSSISNFRSSSAGASSYGNLYSAPRGGGALSSSIQKINQRSARAVNPASAFGGAIGPSGSSTKNLSTGALRSSNLGEPLPALPAAGGSAPVLAGVGATPSAATDKPSATLLMSDADAITTLTMLAEHSGRAYAAMFAPSPTPEAGNDKDGKPITTLVPKSGGSRRYRQLLRKGEEAFRKEDYKQASQAFGVAHEISAGSSESLLSLLHVHFATAQNRYNVPSHYLQRILKDVPELPLISVHPRDFYGNVGTFVENMIQLEEYVKSKPKDANAQLVLAYVKWREKQPNLAAAALRQAMENSKNNEELIDAIQTFWKGMVHSGAVAGKLEDNPASSENEPSPVVAPIPTDQFPLPE